MKNTKKLISVLLVALLLISTAVVAVVSVGAATGTLASVYQTNPNGQYGKQATITIDGSFSDWSEDMLIARSAAWDCPNHWKGAHENNLADCYAMFGAWDSSNLYLGLQFVNTTDTWQRPGDASLSDNGKMNDIPIVIALNTNKANAMNGKASDGKGIWGLNIGYTTRVDHILCFSSTPGLGNPGFFKANSSGATDYNDTQLCQTFAATGVSYKKADGNVCSQIMGLDYSEDPDDVYSDSANWVDFKTFTGSQGKHNTQYDTFYEIKIPLASLGMTVSELTANGIGAMFIGTRGESGMDCTPFDTTMLDNVMGSYSKDPSTSKEKEDDDDVTIPLARVGAQGGNDPIYTDPVTTDPITTDPITTDATQPVGDTLTVNSTSNLFPTSTQSGLSVGDTLTVKYNLKSSKKIASADWSLSYDSSKLRIKTSGTALCPVGGGVINDSGNPIYGNFTDVTNQYDFTLGDTFVQAEFEVLAAGTANVNLNVEEMNVLTGTTLQSVVENSVVKSVSGVTVTPTSQIDAGGVTPGATLTVRGTSNLFDDATGTFDESTNKVTVSYRLKSSKKVANAEWKLTYDTSKLSLDTVSMPKASPTLNTNTPGTVFGNFTDTNLVSYSTMDDFVVATFNVLGTGTTTVNLQVINLGIGNPVTGDIQFAYLVDDGVVKNISGQSGFSGYTYSTQTLINAADDVLAGDVDLNGTVNVQDATLLQRYFAEYTTLTSAQLRAADANKDGKVNIRDVTQIQRIKAGFVS